MRLNALNFFILTSMLLPALRAAEETTQSHLARYGEKLADAWRSYPQEKDMLIRKQKIGDLSQTFMPELKKLDPPRELTLAKIVSTFFSNLEKARTLFTNPKSNSEKSAYLSACGSVFKAELPFATDVDLQRPASKCFEILANWSDDARSRLRVVPEDAHGQMFSNLTEAFGLMLKSASKDEGDPSAIYEQQIKEIQKRCPVNSPTLQKVNAPIKSMLEAAAKKVLDLNKK